MLFRLAFFVLHFYNILFVYFFKLIYYNFSCDSLPKYNIAFSVLKRWVGLFAFALQGVMETAGVEGLLFVGHHSSAKKDEV